MNYSCAYEEFIFVRKTFWFAGKDDKLPIFSKNPKDGI